MKPGGGHEKGAAFERECAKALSAWLTGGQDTRALWRTVGSGAHAARFGAAQAGDISVLDKTHPNVAVFGAVACVELKHYRTLDWGAFLVRRTGVLEQFWSHLVEEARGRAPVLIARSNRQPTVVAFPRYRRQEPHWGGGIAALPLQVLLASPPEPFLGHLAYVCGVSDDLRCPAPPPHA